MMENKKVEYFGINIDSDDQLKIVNYDVINKNQSNYLRNDFKDGITMRLKELKEEHWPYLSCPMLFLRFDLLDFYTHKMKNNSVITNCNALKALAKNGTNSYVMFTIKKMVKNVSKTFYVLHAENDPTFIPTTQYYENMHIGKCLEATLKEKQDEYHIFGCYKKSINVGNSLVNFYYTHQIDLFDSKMNPIEVKAVSLHKYSKKTLDQKLSENDSGINTVLQCRIGEVGKVIFGLHDKVEAKMTQMDLTDPGMEKCFKSDVDKVKKSVDSLLKNMMKNLHDILEKYQSKNWNAVRFSLDSPNNWKFEEIDLKTLLDTYDQL